MSGPRRRQSGQTRAPGGPAGLARSLLFSRLLPFALLASVSPMSACIIPVAPSFQDPPSTPDSPPYLSNFSPKNFNDIVTVPVPAGQVFSATVSDPTSATRSTFVGWSTIRPSRTPLGSATRRRSAPAPMVSRSTRRSPRRSTATSSIRRSPLRREASAGADCRRPWLQHGLHPHPRRRPRLDRRFKRLRGAGGLDDCDLLSGVHLLDLELAMRTHRLILLRLTLATLSLSACAGVQSSSEVGAGGSTNSGTGGSSGIHCRRPRASRPSRLT